MRRRRTINKMRGGGAGEMVILTPDHIKTIKADDSLEHEIKDMIVEEMGLKLDSKSNEIKIYRTSWQQPMSVSEGLYPKIYPILLDIYKSSNKFIEGMMLILTSSNIISIQNDYTSGNEMKAIKDKLVEGMGLEYNPLSRVFHIRAYNTIYSVYKDHNLNTYKNLLNIYNRGGNFVEVSQGFEKPKTTGLLSRFWRKPESRVEKLEYGEEGKYSN